MDIYCFLEAKGIDCERHDHPAVFTVEEANRLVPSLPAAKTKNLFLRKADALQCHPLANTSTLVISREGIRRFLEATGHEPLVLDVPARS